MANSSDRSFLTTQWALVRDASSSAPQRHAALEELCRSYWYPLYGYLRRQGLERPAAEDTLQSFFVRLLESDFLAAADPERGRFRSFLLASIRHFLANERRAQSAQRRGGAVWIASLDVDHAEQRFGHEPIDSQATPEEAFERQWAWTLVERAIQMLRERWEDSGKKSLFEALAPTITPGDGLSDYESLAEQLGMTAGAIKVAAHRLRKQCAETIREEIRRTVVSDEEVEDELHRLFNSLAP